MRDCSNVEMRDLLPDLLHGRLSAALRLEVQRHADGCADCRAELLILRHVIAVSATPRVDVSRIAAAVPPYHPGSAWRRAAASPVLRIAAAILLLAGGAALIDTVATRARAPAPVQRTVQAPAVSPPGVEPAAVATPASRGATSGVASRAPAPVELAVGESFHDLSDAELRALIGDLDKWEAVTSTETDAVAPSLGRGGQ